MKNGLTQVDLKITGVAPLLMHNGRLADPSNEYARELKKITAKKDKTEDDLLEMSRVEWWGGLYTDLDNKKVVLSSDMVWAVGLAGAKKKKKGKLFQAGVVENGTEFDLEYDGPKDLKKLQEDERFADKRMVRIGRVKVLRTRPRFNQWACSISLLVNTDIIDVEDVIHAYEDAGTYCGFGDWIPRFGRFTVEGV